MTPNDQIFFECVLYYRFKWPIQLWTGVMFFKGVKVTIQDFVETANKYKEYVGEH